MRGIAGAVCFFMGLFVIIVLLIVILVLAQIAEAFVLGLGLRLGIFVGLGEQGAGLAGPGEYLIDEFEDLVVFDFAIDEVEVVLVLDVAEDVQSRAAALEDGVESHLVVVEFAGVQHHVFHD